MLTRFNDEIEIDTDGPLRPLHPQDGCYVVGQGILMPVESVREALEQIEAIKKGSKP
jgi:hypothetical protein